MVERSVSGVCIVLLPVELPRLRRLKQNAISQLVVKTYFVLEWWNE